MSRADCEIPELEHPSPLITFGCKVMMSCEQMGFTVMFDEFHNFGSPRVRVMPNLKGKLLKYASQKTGFSQASSHSVAKAY